MATIRDYIRECEIYPHSQECYNLMKECAEIDVMAQFIENQQFMAENAAMFIDEAASFTEGYLVESVDDVTLDAVMESFKGKIGNVKSTIANGIKKAWSAFINFLRKIRTLWDNDFKRAAAIKAILSKGKVDDEKANAIKALAKKAVTDSGFKVKSNQPTLKEIKIDYQTSDTEFSEAKNILAAALSQNVAVAEVSGSADAGSIGAICAKTIVKACKGVGSAKGKDIYGIQSTMNAAWKDSLKNGVPIYVKAADIDEMLKAMEEMKTTIDQLNKENSEDMVDPYASNTAENMRALSAVYGSITTSIGKTMDVYAAYKKFRSSVMSGMESLFSSKSKDKSEEESEPAEETSES